jgi:hypothetical protein
MMMMMMQTLIGLGKSIREDMSYRDSLSYCELKRYKPWFDEEYSKLLDER